MLAARGWRWSLEIKCDSAVLKHRPAWWYWAGLPFLTLGAVHVALGVTETGESPTCIAWFGVTVQMSSLVWIIFGVVFLALGTFYTGFRYGVTLDRVRGRVVEWYQVLLRWTRSTVVFDSLEAVVVNADVDLADRAPHLEYEVNLELGTREIKLVDSRRQDKAVELAERIAGFLGLKISYRSVGSETGIERSVAEAPAIRSGGNGKRLRIPGMPEGCRITLLRHDHSTQLVLPCDGFGVSQHRDILAACLMPLCAPFILAFPLAGLAQGDPFMWPAFGILAALLALPMAFFIGRALWTARAREQVILSSQTFIVERRLPWRCTRRCIRFDQLEMAFLVGDPPSGFGRYVTRSSHSILAFHHGLSFTFGRGLTQEEGQWLVDVLNSLAEAESA